MTIEEYQNYKETVKQFKRDDCLIEQGKKIEKEMLLKGLSIRFLQCKTPEEFCNFFYKNCFDKSLKIKNQISP